MLNSAPGGLLSAGVPGSLLDAEASAGSPQPRTPAGVFAAFRSLNIQKSLLTQPENLKN